MALGADVHLEADMARLRGDMFEMVGKLLPSIRAEGVGEVGVGVDVVAKTEEPVHHLDVLGRGGAGVVRGYSYRRDE